MWFGSSAWLNNASTAGEQILKITKINNKQLWHIQKEDNRTPEPRNVVLTTRLKCQHWRFAQTVALTTSTTLSAQLADTIVVNWL